MDKQRELFEEWAKAELMNTTKYGATDVYCYPDAHRAWAAWQAAIASVVVDIESLPSASYTDDGVIYRSHVEDALEKAGIKWKE